MLTHYAWYTCNRMSVSAITIVLAQDHRPTTLCQLSSEHAMFTSQSNLTEMITY